MPVLRSARRRSRSSTPATNRAARSWDGDGSGHPSGPSHHDKRQRSHARGHLGGSENAQDLPSGVCEVAKWMSAICHPARRNLADSRRLPSPVSFFGCERTRTGVFLVQEKRFLEGAPVPLTDGSDSSHARASFGSPRRRMPGEKRAVVPGWITSSNPRASSHLVQRWTERRDRPVVSIRRAIVGRERSVSQSADQPTARVTASMLAWASDRRQAASGWAPGSFSHRACVSGGVGAGCGTPCSGT